MSYAQRHRTRLELHQSTLGLAPSSAETSPLNYTPPRKSGPAVVAGSSLHGDRASEGGGNAGPQRSTSSLLRANAAHMQQGHGAGIDIAAWSDAASNAVSGERQPFQLLQHTPPKNEPPRLKASRKQFASPHVSATASEANQSLPVALPIVVNSDSPDAASKREAGGHDPQATDLRTGDQATTATTGAAPAVNDASSQPLAEAEADGGAIAAGEMSPSPIPVSHQPSQPQPQAPPPPQFADSSAPSSARASTSQWPASETFTARLRNIMETRQQIEALVQKQREDEAEMVQAIASLDEQSQLHPVSSQQQSPNSPTPRGTVSRQVYEQVLMERNAAFAALREFKEKGNAIVHHLYDTVKTQQEQSLELVATVEALKKANKRLKEAVSSNSGGSGGRASDSAPIPGTVAELQQKVATQRRVIEQMDQLMQNADRMLLTMRARVEAAERRAATTAPLDRRQLPPLPKGSSTGGAARPAGALSAATVATPDAVAAIERLAERYTTDPDVATVAAQQQLLLERIAQLRQSLKQEEAQRLHLEEVYGATSEETARNVALLEERLQRAENPRGVPFASGGGASNATALRHELHTLLEEKGEEKEEVRNGESKNAAKAAPVDEEHDAGEDAEEPHPQPQQEEEAAFVEEEEEQQQERPPTPSHASSRASSRSSTPSRTLFTAVSVGDVNSTTAANEAADGGDSKAATGLRVVVPTNSTDAAALPVPAEVAAPPESAESDAPMSPLPVTSPKKDASPPPLPHPQKTSGSPQQQPRAFLGRRRSSSSNDKADAAASPAAAATTKAPLGIPVPDASSLGNSLRRSFNSRSSSASRRIVDFRPAAADATSRGLDSMSDVEEEEETVDVDGEDVEEKKDRKHSSYSKSSNSDSNNKNRSSGITGVTPTITPTAIHSATSPLPDTSTSAEMSAKRQQRLHQQKEELDKLEADVTNVVRSLEVE